MDKMEIRKSEDQDVNNRLSGSGYQDIRDSELKTPVLISVNPCLTEP